MDNLILIAILPVVSGLVGTWLGHRMSANQQRQRIHKEHVYADRTRFHSERLQTYANYLGASMSVKSLSSIIRSRGNEENVNAIRYQHTEANSTLNAALGSIQIISTTQVRIAAYRLWNYVVHLINDDTTTEDEATERTADLTNALQLAMRNELGIEGGVDGQADH